MEVKKLEIDSEQYLNLLGENPSIFNTVNWLKLFENKIELFGVFSNKNKLVASFCFYHFKKMGITFYIQPPYCPHNLVLIAAQANHPVALRTITKSILESMAIFFEKNKNPIFEFSFPTEFSDMQPFIWKNFEVSPKYTYKLDLIKNENELLSGLSDEVRDNLKKALKNGLRCELTHDYTTTKKLIYKTIEHQKVKTDKALFDRILFEFANMKNSFSFIVYDGETPVSTTFCLYDTQVCYYLAGGYDREIKATGAGVLALWDSILEAKKLGVPIFDFEGSMIPSIEKYFRGFGGELMPMFQIKKSSKIFKVLLSFKNFIKF